MTEAQLRSFGLSSVSLEAVSEASLAAIAALVDRAAGELCTARYAGDTAGVAVNLLGEATQLTAAVAGPLVALSEPGALDRLRVLPLDQSLCVHTLATAEGHLDLADPGEKQAQLHAHLGVMTGGSIRSYAGVAIEVDGVRVGSLCVYGPEPSDAARRDAREAGLRRYGSLLSRQLAEAARLTAENAALREELRGAGSALVGDEAVFGDSVEAAAWRETIAILGDVERSVAASGPAGASGVAACVVEADLRTGRVAILATSEVADARFGMRPCLLRQVGDDALAPFWDGALQGGVDDTGAPRVFHEDSLATAVAAARLGAAPGTFASVTAARLPGGGGRAGTARGLVVLAVAAPSSAAEVAGRRTLVLRFAAAVAEAQRLALAVCSAPPPGPLPPGEDLEPDPDAVRRTRQAFGSMKLRPLLALAEERGVEGTDAATSVDDLLHLIARHATRLGRARRAHLEALSLRDLLRIGEEAVIPDVERAETKRDMIAAILDAEGLPAPAPAGDLPRLAVPPRPVRTLTPEQREVRFDPEARWLREGCARVDESLPYSLPGAWTHPSLPRPPVPADEALRNAAIGRLGLDDLRDFTAADLVTFDGIAAGAAALAGAVFGAVTLIRSEEQVVVGVTDRPVNAPFHLGDAEALPRVTAHCQYGVVKGAAVAVADVTTPDAGPLGQMVCAAHATMPQGFSVLARSYLGVPLVTAEGVVLGNVCIIDDKPRPDFADDRRIVAQLEGLAATIVNLFELRRLRRENSALNARRQLDVAAVQPLGPGSRAGAPTDRVAFLITDIEGSTGLHERDRTLMKRALEVHDAVMRRAIADNGGVEVGTEGDSFLVAFHGAADAIRCAFDAQLRLLSAPWPAGLELLGPSTAPDEARKLAGCRVRMTIHFADAGGGLLGRRRFDVARHAVTRRPLYRGPFVEEARYVAEMASGGQILVTQEAFDEVALTLTTALGDPRVIDLGRYRAPALGDLGHVYEITPRALAARTFTPPLRVPAGAEVIAPGYIHAPRSSPLVVLFVLPVGLAELSLASDAGYARALESFTSTVRDALAAEGGYEMKESEGVFMCAFPIDQVDCALTFARDVHGRLERTSAGALRCRVGINSGEVAVEPHVRTGRLEAYGPPCNRASRLAKAAAAGQSLVDSGTAALAGPGLTVPLHDLGERRFRGVDEPLRVLQIGGGHHPPVRSESYTAELVDYMRSPTGNVTRARALLGLMDAHGVDAVPLLGDVVAERGKVQAMLDAGLAERSAEEASSRVTAGAPPR